VGPDNPQRVALLSIKPQFAQAIFAGHKTVEFRRARLAPDIKLALVYATQPTGLVIGWFRINRIAESTPDGLWRRYRRHGAISRRDYFTYFDGTDRAYGIEIGSPTIMDKPLTLDEILAGLRAPQSFQYLPAELASPILITDRPAQRRIGKLQPAFV
jgi:predicted transcriptional regulator